MAAKPAAVALRLLPLLGFAAVLALVQSGWRPLRRLDLDVADGLNGVFAPHPGWVTCWKVVSTVGQPGVFQVLAVLTGLVLVLWRETRRRQVPRAVWTVATVLLAGLVSNIVKWSVGRPRPTVPEPLAHAAGTSFPSGHALSSLVGTAVLIMVWSPGRRIVVAGGAVVVVLIGFSRLALGVHNLSDVVAGWLLGTTWVLLTTAVLTTVTGLTTVTNPSWPSRPSASPDQPPRTRSG